MSFRRPGNGWSLIRRDGRGVDDLLCDPFGGSGWPAFGAFLVVVRGGWGFLSLRDPTTRWSGHPRVRVVFGTSSLEWRDG
jgi:hypothetical protein